MKIYRTHIRRDGNESEGFKYFSNKLKATKAQNKSNIDNEMDDEVEEIEFKLTKKGVIELLMRCGSHADNG